MIPRSFTAIQVGFGGNLLLAVGKTAAGWWTGSQAVLADGLHSFTDVLSTVISWVGGWIASEPPDEDHPLGHGAADNLAALLVAGVMAYAGYLLVERGVTTLLREDLRAPEAAAAWVAAAGLVLKELMHRHALEEWQGSRSPSVLALAKDHRSDALSALAALGGVVGARLGTPLLDPLAAILIAALILRLAWETGIENAQVLLDREPDIDPLREELLRRAGAHDPPLRIRNVRGHEAGAEITLEIDLQVPPELSVSVAHGYAHAVEDWAKEIDERVIAAQVHIEPFGADED